MKQDEHHCIAGCNEKYEISYLNIKIKKYEIFYKKNKTEKYEISY